MSKPNHLRNLCIIAGIYFFAILIYSLFMALFAAPANCAPVEVRVTASPFGNRGTCATPILIPKTLAQNIAYLWAFVSGPTPTADFADTVWNVTPGVTVFRYYDLAPGSTWMLHARPMYGRGMIVASCDTMITVEVAPPTLPLIQWK